MKRDELIQKWLNHELNAEELEAFKNLEDYDALMNMNSHLQAFKAPEYDSHSELDNVLKQIKTKKTKPQNWVRTALRIAAVVVVCFSVYYSITLDTTFSTLASNKETNIELPDASTVSLNALSAISFNKHNWNKKRKVELKGEAFFKVAKGSTFEVVTKHGTITVLGTQFNVKHRDNYFEVICYEGKVGVNFQEHQTTLLAGDSFLFIDGKLIAKEKEKLATPSWLNNESQFMSMPYKLVLDEFERQFGVQINSSNIDTSQLFTGGFSHSNMELALKAITLPLHLSYNKTNSTITLKRD
ncbi:FecR family protein [Geojedonia litorea]|uniref:FecR family protein n=1 Tax=Geojedonia litorea TaxID=1268269 RepID=A0ABV9N0D3_9FLAO